MDDLRFDLLTKQLAQDRVSRRAAFNAARPGLAAALALAVTGRVTAAKPLSQSTPAADLNAINIDGAWLCNQTFGLCTTAPCTLSEDDPTIANCECVVENNYSIGFRSCAERAQVGTAIVSNFSTANVNPVFSVMTCPEDAPWANCLDVPCEIDSINPARAVCQCAVVETGPSLTFGGGCDTATCTETIWSAAPPGLLGLAQYEEGMKQVNRAVTLPESCSSGGTPVASPAATPASA